VKRITLKDIKSSWSDIITQLEKNNSKVAHFLEDAQVHSFDGEQVLIELMNGHKFHLRTLEKDAGLVEEEMYGILGQDIKIKFHLQDDAEEGKTEAKHSKGETMKNNSKELLGRAQSIITELSRELEEKSIEHDEYKKEVAEYQKDVVEYKEMAEDKIGFYDTAMSSDDWLSMDEVAKIINFEGWGRNDLFKFLREGRILKTNIGHNQPYQQYVKRKYFKLIEELWEDKKGRTHIYSKTVVSQKGVEWIGKQLDAYISNI
jgi:phage antirepressor YoqD-like protein